MSWLRGRFPAQEASLPRHPATLGIEAIVDLVPQLEHLATAWGPGLCSALAHFAIRGRKEGRAYTVLVGQCVRWTILGFAYDGVHHSRGSQARWVWSWASSPGPSWAGYGVNTAPNGGF